MPWSRGHWRVSESIKPSSTSQARPSVIGRASCPSMPAARRSVASAVSGRSSAMARSMSASVRIPSRIERLFGRLVDDAQLAETPEQEGEGDQPLIVLRRVTC